MNAKKFNILLYSILFMVVSTCFAESAHIAVKKGNKLYHAGNLDEAIDKYKQATEQAPEALEPVFNKGNCLYKQNKLDSAIDIYQKLAGKSKNPNLAAKANYNLGNCYYNKAIEQAQQNPENAIKDIKTGINYWRKAKEGEVDSGDITKNIEVAKMAIKQLKKQMQQQNKQSQKKQNKNKQKENQQQKQNQQQQNGSNEPQKEKQQEDKSKEQEDKNQQQQNQQQAIADSNNKQEQQPQIKENKEKENPQEDMIAQKILDKEQKQKEQRKKLRRTTYKKVEKDW